MTVLRPRARRAALTLVTGLTLAACAPTGTDGLGGGLGGGMDGGAGMGTTRDAGVGSGQDEHEESEAPEPIPGGRGQAGFLVATAATGVLAARFGPRVPVTAGCLLLAVGAALIASAPGPMLLAVGVVAAGKSAGGTWAPFSDAVDNQVPSAGQRRALALVNTGSSVGLVVASLLVLLVGDDGGPCGGRSLWSASSRPRRPGGCWNQ